MSDETLLRLSGIAAITGGALRIADAFLANGFGARTLAPVYFLTDIFLLVGTLGIFISRRSAVGWMGLAATALAFVGLLVVRSETVRFFGIGGYQVGAPAALVGITVLGILLALKGYQRVAATFWLAALAVGIAAPQSSAFMFFVAGILYGAGFVAAGSMLAFERSDATAPARL